MGHYCNICGRTRANEKFSGKGYKNHVCKDCSGKSGRKTDNIAINETNHVLDALLHSEDAYIQSESTFGEESLICETAFENSDAEDETDKELPF